MAASSLPRSMRKDGAKLERALPGLKERAKTLVELLDSADYLFAKRPLALDEQGREAARRGRRAKSSARCCRSSRRVEPWTPEALEAAVRAYAEEAGLKLGKVAQPLRAALTGRRDLARHLRCARGARPGRSRSPASRDQALETKSA